MLSTLSSPMLRPISALSGSDNMVPDFVRLGFTAEIPLPNQGFPAPFIGSLGEIVVNEKSLNRYRGSSLVDMATMGSQIWLSY